MARKAPFVIFWFALGLLGLAARTAMLEPSRAIVAWPAFCLLAASSMHWLQQQGWQRLPKLAAELLIAVFLAALVSETKAYRQSMDAAYSSCYENSFAEFKAAQFAHQQGMQASQTVLTDLDFYPATAFRFLLGRLPQAKDQRSSWARVPWSYLPALGPTPVEDWVIFANSKDQPICYLFHAKGSLQKWLSAIDSSLRNLWSKALRLPLDQRRGLFLDYLSAKPEADPWLRTACWDAVVHLSFFSLDFSPRWVQSAMQEPLLSAGPLWYSASRFSETNPSLALDLYNRASAMDPRLQLAPDALQALRSLAAKKQNPFRSEP